MAATLTGKPLKEHYGSVIHFDGTVVGPQQKWYLGNGAGLQIFSQTTLSKTDLGVEIPSTPINVSTGTAGLINDNYARGILSIRRLGQTDYSSVEYYRSATPANNMAGWFCVHAGVTSGLFCFVDRSIRPAAGNVQSLGFANYAWKDIYTVNAVTVTSDKRLKDYRDCSLGLSFICDLKPVEYKWKPMPEDNGKLGDRGTRYHTGLLAQDVEATLGKKSSEMALWCQHVPGDADSLQMLRYEEFIAPLIKAVQELNAEVQSLKKELLTYR